VTGFDLSHAMVAESERRVGNRGEFRVLNLMDAASRFRADRFAGVLCANVTQFLPTRGMARRAVTGLSSLLVPFGSMYVATTMYPQRKHTRTLDFVDPTSGRMVVAGSVTYHRYRMGLYRDAMTEGGIRVSYQARFDSGEYRNQFLIGRKETLPNREGGGGARRDR